MSPITITILILLLMIAAFMSGKFPLGVCGMFCCIALLVTGVLTPAEALAGFANTNVVIMLSMMVVTAGLMKTSLLDKIFSLVRRVGGNSYVGIIGGFGLVIIILSQFMNAFIALSCLLPLITGICDDMKLSRSRVIMPIAAISLAWIQMFPFAYGASMYAMMSGFLESFDPNAQFGMWTLVKIRIPGAILVTLFCVFFMYKTCPAEPSVEVRNDLGKKLENSTLSKGKETLAYVIAIGTIVLMMTSSVHGFSSYTCAALGAYLMVATGILTEKECFASVNWGLIFMFAGMLPMATALNNTGASDIVAEAIQNFLGGATNPWVINIAFGVTAWILTQFMSNLAMINVFTPLAIMVCLKSGMNPIGVMGLIVIAATASMLTPMATPGIPLAMGAGGYNFKDVVKTGILPSVIQLVTGIIWCTIAFPAK